MKRIKDIPEFNRPREKLTERGASALSDTELIAVILGSGNKGRDVLSLSSKVAKLLTENKGKLSMEQLSVMRASASKSVTNFSWF